MFLGGGGGSAGRTVIVLDLERVQGTPLRGTWTVVTTGLKCQTPAPQPGQKDDDRMPVFELNYIPPEEYDFEIEFTRAGGSVVQMMSAQGVSFAHEFTQGSDNGTPSRAGLTSFDKKSIHAAAEGSVMITPPARNGTRHVAVVQVRKGSVQSFLNGKPVLNWSGDFSRLSLPTGFRLSGDEGRLGLGSWGGEVTFLRAVVREISGQGQVTSSDTLAGGGASKSNLSSEDIAEVAKWAISLKGFIVVQSGGVNRKVTTVEDIPSTPGELIDVDVPGNRPSTTLPGMVANVLKRSSGLKRLALRNCSLTTADAAALIAGKPLITNLNLNGNKVDDAIIDKLISLADLEAIDFGWCKSFSGSSIQKLASLSKLNNVALYDSMFSDAGLAGISKLKGIKNLQVNGTKVTDTGLASMGPMGQLDQANFKYTDITVRGLGALRSATKLRRIELSLGRGITDIREFAGLKDIFPELKEMVIDISGPKEKEYAPQLGRLAELTALKALTRLDLRGSSNLPASTIAGVTSLPLLDYLDIPYKFNDADVAAVLKGTRSIRTLRLGNADLTEAGAMNLAGVASLRDVNKGAFDDAGLKVFKEFRPDVKISD